MLSVGRGPRGSNAGCSTLCHFSITSPTTHNQIGPFWCWFAGGWVCVCARPLWVSPMNSPVRLGVSPAPTSIPTGVSSQKLWVFISAHWNPGLHGLSGSPVVPPSLSAHKYGTAHSASWLLTQSASRRLAASPLCPRCPSPSLLPVWMNVSSLTPWLSDFHIIRFSVSSGCFLFLNLLFSFWLCEEAQCVYLRLHLGQKSW